MGSVISLAILLLMLVAAVCIILIYVELRRALPKLLELGDRVLLALERIQQDERKMRVQDKADKIEESLNSRESG
jgi:signal transduction histidine kinase